MDIMNGIIDTESAMHPLVLLIGLLKTNGKLVLVGALEKPFELAAFSLLMCNCPFLYVYISLIIQIKIN